MSAMHDLLHHAARLRNEQRALDAQSFEPMNRLRSTLIRLAAIYTRKRGAMEDHASEMRRVNDPHARQRMAKKLASLEAECGDLKTALRGNRAPMEALFAGAPIEEIAALPLMQDADWRALEEEVRP